MTLPILPTKNLAPVQPLYALANGENPQPSYIADALKELLDDVLKRNEDTWREIAETTEITNNFIQGKQIFQRTSQGLKVMSFRRTDPSKVCCINLMQSYTTENLRRIISSNPDLEPEDEFKRADFRKQVQINAAVWNKYERKFYTARFNQQEALHAIVSGTYIESVQYDYLEQGAKVFQELWGEKQVPISDGNGKCYSCGLEGDFGAFESGQCAECGSYEIYAEPPVSQTIPSVVGLQPIVMGDLRLKLIPIQAVRFDLKKTPEESSYFLERMTVPIGKLKHLLGANLKLESADISDDRGLQSLETIAKSGNTLLGKQSLVGEKTTTDKEVVLDRLSLLPQDYAHIFPKEEQSVDGQKISAEKLTDICPNGLTAVFINKEHLFGIYPDVHHSKEVASGTYHARYGSGVGRGSEDTVEVQKRFNRNDAQMMRAGETGATPAHWFIEGAVDKKHIAQIGMPGYAIPVKSAVAQSLGKTELIGQLQPAGMAGTFFQYTYDILDKYRQMVSHAPDVTNNLTGANRSGTATEAQISDANAEAIYAPMLQIKADVRKRIAGLTLKGFKKHFKSVQQYFTFGKSKQGETVGDYVSGEQVDDTIPFAVVANSERPKTRYTQQQGLATVLQLVGGVEGLVMLKQADPELLDEILDAFGIELTTNTYDSLDELCRKRVEQITQAAEEYEQIANGQIPLIPEILLLSLSPRIRPTEPAHAEKMKWLADFLDSPEGQNMSETQRDAIDMLIMAHRNGGVIQTGNLMQAGVEAEMIANEPMRQQQMQDEQMRSEQEFAQQQQKAEDERNARTQEQNDARDFQMMQKAQEQAFQASQAEQSAQLEREKMQA